MKFAATEITEPTFQLSISERRKVLSPDLVIFDPAERGAVQVISAAMNALSSESPPEEYGRVKSVQSIARSSIGNGGLDIPCLAFIGRVPWETVAASSRLLAVSYTHLTLPTIYSV